jgi:hypothetical protein
MLLSEKGLLLHTSFDPDPFDAVTVVLTRPVFGATLIWLVT